MTSHTEEGDHTDDDGHDGDDGGPGDGDQPGGGADSCDHHWVRGAGHELLRLLAYKWQNN